MGWGGVGAHRLPDRAGHTEKSVSPAESSGAKQWICEATLLTSGQAKGLMRNTVTRSDLICSAGNLHNDEKTLI